MTIEVALCERCGSDSPWHIARQAHRGRPGCPSCGSEYVSRAAREQTPQEIERLMQSLRERKGSCLSVTSKNKN